MAHGKKKRPLSFGRGFDLLLRDCEEWEDFALGRRNKPGPDFSMNTDLFEVYNEPLDQWKAYYVDMGENAWRLRNSFKFKLDYSADYEGSKFFVADEMARTPLSPPFEQCFFIAENWHENCTLMMLLDERTATHIDGPTMLDAYAKHGIYPGDKFLSVMPVIYREDGIIDEKTGIRDKTTHLSYWPVEIHFRLHGSIHDGNSGLAATPHFAKPRADRWNGKPGEGQQDDGFRAGTHLLVVSTLYFFIYMLSKHQPKRQAGRPPQKAKGPKQVGKRTLYEHHTLEIDPLKVHPEPTGISRPHGSPRLHAVRGFWRQYKSGKRVWIKPHWRGNKERGVVTKDYSIVPGAESPEAGAGSRTDR